MFEVGFLPWLTEDDDSDPDVRFSFEYPILLPDPDHYLGINHIQDPGILPLSASFKASFGFPVDWIMHPCGFVLQCEEHPVTFDRWYTFSYFDGSRKLVSSMRGHAGLSAYYTKSLFLFPTFKSLVAEFVRSRKLPAPPACDEPTCPSMAQVKYRSVLDYKVHCACYKHAPDPGMCVSPILQIFSSALWRLVDRKESRPLSLQEVAGC